MIQNTQQAGEVPSLPGVESGVKKVESDVDAFWAKQATEIESIDPGEETHTPAASHHDFF